MVVVPDYAPETKVSAMERLGADVVKKPFDEWWEALEESRLEGVDGLFLHPVENEQVMAGNGTIGLEILKDLPDPDLVLIPFGGGGLTTGIASAIKAERPETKVYCVEQDTAAPLNATLEAGSMQAIDYQVSFVDGAGAKALLPKMWGLVEPLIDGAYRVSLDEVAGTIRILAQRVRVIAEGAGALAPAAALSPGRRGEDRLHRLGREHRFPRLVEDPGGRDALGEERAVVAQRGEDGVDVLARVVAMRGDAQVAVARGGDDPLAPRAPRRARRRPST